MLRKKCQSCAKKISKKFSYCPHCGVSFKAIEDREDFGILGRNDNEIIQEELKLPFGIEKIMNSLVKQLEKQMSNVDFKEMQGMPKNINIRIARGVPQMGQVVRMAPQKVEKMPMVSEKENERRMILPKIEVDSKVRRLANSIIYEIETPGVNKKEDVVVTELATGLEIKAYSKDKCYVKFIPLKVEVIEYYVDKEKVFVELKS